MARFLGKVPQASITGTVKDMSGAVLQGAAVTVKHLETGLTRAAEADASGNYNVPSLPVGAYEVTAEKMGFQREVRRGIDLVVGQEAEVNLSLRVGSIDQQVTVTEDAPLVNTTLASTSGLINESQVKDLPLNGRSFDQLHNAQRRHVQQQLEYAQQRLLERFLGGGQAAGNQPVSDQRGRLDWRERDGPVHHAVRRQRAVAGGGSGAGIQSRLEHLWRRVWEAGRRARSTS